MLTALIGITIFQQNVTYVIAQNYIDMLWWCVIFGLKIAHSSWRRIFFRKTINIILIYLMALSIVQKLKKDSWSNSRVMRSYHLNQNDQLAPNRNFFGKSNNIFLIYLLPSFIVWNIKRKSFERILRKLKICKILASRLWI